ncbi:glutathione peroxidase [Aurantiacibacter zhengii]|uniref:Glutathione peroxidase n=1 Tax=Aurantiacibacter zhengii TaxID=2307003 RepID=A0A418NTG1_9SPHN|nr:glutathione peroxidase [Aurantiacibacter zhengii]RIV86757.1 glutathione peroxidase [Aurantiacibacter zhengii]
MSTLPETIELSRINGQSETLGEHRGNVLLVVNTASQCGLTPQYGGLEELHRRYADRGFEVLGFPSNDFGNQEPGSEEEIASFCEVNYQTSFPLFAKTPVTGADKHPLYAALTQAKPEKTGPAEEMRARFREHGMTPNEDPEVLWNFEKFLVGRDGEVLARFAPATAPDDPALLEAIEAALEH